MKVSSESMHAAIGWWRAMTVAAAAFLPGIVPSARAEAAAEWRAGFASAVVTPTQPVSMGGFAQRDHPSTGVVNDLYVKALALADDKGHQAVLVTCDTIGFRSQVAEQICSRIMEATGFERSQILLNSSHTHTGPTQAVSVRPQGNLDVVQARAVFDYTVWLKDRVVDTALTALKRLEPARFSYATGLVLFPVNRREHTKNGVILGFNPSGPADRTVPLLKVTAADGSLLGVVFGAACHNTTIPALDYEICGDFSGFAQQQVEEKFPGTVALFMQGCGGDTSPYPTGSLAYARQHGHELGMEVGRLIREAKFQPIHGPLRTRLTYAQLPLTAPPSLAEIEAMSRERASWKKMSAAQMLAAHQAGVPLPTHYRAPVAFWQFGSDLRLVGLPGEPMAEYVTLAQKALGPLNLWVAGYCNDVFGYLPTEQVLREGGYEARGLYGGRTFAPTVQSAVESVLRELAAEPTSSNK